MNDVTFAEARDLMERGIKISHEMKIAHALPLNDRVLLRRIEQEKRDIDIPDAWKPKSNIGEVLAIGKDAVGQLMKGERVIFGYYSAQDITVDGEELVLISIHDIWLRL